MPQQPNIMDFPDQNFSDFPDQNDYSDFPDQNERSWGDWAVSTGLRTAPAIAGSILGMGAGPLGGVAGGVAGGALGEYLGQWWDKPEEDTNWGLVGVEGGLNAIPFVGKIPGAGRGIKEIAKYAGKGAFQGGLQGAVGSFPRHWAEQGNLTDPEKWEAPSGKDIALQTIGGAGFGAVTSGGLGAANRLRANRLKQISEAGPTYDDLQASLQSAGSRTHPYSSADPNFNQGQGDPMLAGSTPYTQAAPLPHSVTLKSATREKVEMLKQQGYVPGGTTADGYPYMVRKDIAHEYEIPSVDKMPEILQSAASDELDAFSGDTITLNKPLESVIKRMQSQGFTIADINAQTGDVTFKLQGEESKGILSKFLEEEEGSFHADFWKRPKRLPLPGDEEIPELAFQPDEGVSSTREFSSNFLPDEEGNVGQGRVSNPTSQAEIDTETRTAPEGLMNEIITSYPSIYDEALAIYQEINPEQIVQNLRRIAAEEKVMAHRWNEAQSNRLNHKIPVPDELTASYNRLFRLKHLAQAKYERAATRQLKGKQEGIGKRIGEFFKSEEGSFNWEELKANLRRLLRREPTTDEVIAARERQRKPMEPGGRVAQFPTLENDVTPTPSQIDPYAKEVPTGLTDTDLNKMYGGRPLPPDAQQRLTSPMDEIRAKLESGWMPPARARNLDDALGDLEEALELGYDDNVKRLLPEVEAMIDSAPDVDTALRNMGVTSTLADNLPDSPIFQDLWRRSYDTYMDRIRAQNAAGGPEGYGPGTSGPPDYSKGPPNQPWDKMPGPPLNDPRGLNKWDVFDPSDGRPIRTFDTEAEAELFIRSHPNGDKLDYGPTGEGWVSNPSRVDNLNEVVNPTTGEITPTRGPDVDELNRLAEEGLTRELTPAEKDQFRALQNKLYGDSGVDPFEDIPNPFGSRPEDAQQSPYGEDVFPGEFPDADEGNLPPIVSFPREGPRNADGYRVLEGDPEYDVAYQKWINEQEARRRGELPPLQDITATEWPPNSGVYQPPVQSPESVLREPRFPEIGPMGEGAPPNPPLEIPKLPSQEAGPVQENLFGQEQKGYERFKLPEKIRNFFLDEEGTLTIPPPRQKPGAKARKATPDEEDLILEAFNLPRGAVTGMDLSAPMRQGLPMVTSKHFWKAIIPMLRSFRSEKVYRSLDSAIRADQIHAPRINRRTGKVEKSFAASSGIKLSDLGDSFKGREEQVASKWLESIPGAGRMYRAGNRAYTLFLNKLRTDAFKSLIADAERLSDVALKTGEARPGFMKQKFTPDEALMLNPRKNLVLAKEIADAVNTLTGRGPLKMAAPGVRRNAEGNLRPYIKEYEFEGAGKYLTIGLFSPKLQMSRARMMNPMTYAVASPFVRKQYLKGMLSVAGAWTTLASLAKGAGAEVSLDPDSSDFGKIKFGDTRLDPAGGFQQYLVATHRLLTGRYVSSRTGEEFTLGEGYQARTGKSVAEQFITNKFHPVVKFAYDMMNASEHQPFAIGDRTAQLFVPLIIQDLMELADEDPQLLPMMVPVAFGMGTQTYESGSNVEQDPSKVLGTMGLDQYDVNYTGGGFPGLMRDIQR